MGNIKKITPHFIIILLFLVISLTYLSPLLQGKMLNMMDVTHWKGMSKEVVDFRESTGEEPLWTNSMFSGMPAYQISTKYKGNLIQYVPSILSLGLPRPANMLFLYLLGFYILLLSLKVDYRISAIGAIAFAFSSYFFIIIQAGHMTKAHAIAYMPMVIAAVLYTYRGKMLLGGVLTALTVALELYANHLQITYYLILILLFIGFTELVKSIKTNNLVDFLKRSAVLLIAALLASGTSLTRLSTTMEYGKDSTRGKSELTNNLDNKTSGLDKDYATAWSYGVAETFTLLIPNFHGGSSSNSVFSLEDDSETLDFLRQFRNKKIANVLAQKSSSYWGDQPFTSGPTYSGAIVIFLFVLALLFLRSDIRIWVLLATIMSIMLAWGKNFMPLTELFLDYFPGYNKFRAVSMILIIAEFTIPLLAFIALDNFLNIDKEGKKKSLQIAFYITGGITLVFALMPSIFFDFLSESDFRPLAPDVKIPNGFLDGLVTDRAHLLSMDAWRSFVFISLAFGLLWIYLKNKIKKQYVILIVGVLVLFDMWTVNKRYLHNDHFVRKSKVKTPYKPTQADKIIYNKEGFDFKSYPDFPHFRVHNKAANTFNDANTSYFHKSIGGYHGAKLKRYQELIDYHITKENSSVINMLNTKYIINKQGSVETNINAMGNAWFVSAINVVPNADSEIAALNGLDVRNMAVVDERFKDQLITNLSSNNGTISLLEYKPNYLKYDSKSTSDGIAIFSEIYYEKGWNAYIDDVLYPHFRVNYVLRGMKIPAGNHIIEFKFEPSSYNIGESLSLTSSIILLLLLVFVSFKELKS